MDFENSDTGAADTVVVVQHEDSVLASAFAAYFAEGHFDWGEVVVGKAGKTFVASFVVEDGLAVVGVLDV